MEAVLHRLRAEERMLTGADLVARFGLAPDRLVGAGSVIAWQTDAGLRLYPEVQFADDGPVPVVRDVVTFLRAETWPPNELALWFYRPRPALRDTAPVDLLHENPDAVRALAVAETDGHRVMSG